MFDDDKQDDKTQDATSPQADAAATANPVVGTPFNMDNPTPDTTAAPAGEPSSAPTTDAGIVVPDGAAADNPDASDIKPEDSPTATDNEEQTDSDASTPATDLPDLAAAADSLSAGASPSTSEGGQDLLSIKQEALQQLSPLVGHLDQTPEEKFRTTMMMIQAADNQSLVKAAYEAAQQIKDEKERAQALLDVINEINYFTQQSSDKDG